MSWKTGLLPFAVLAGLLVGLVVVADALQLERGPGLGGSSLCFLCYLIAPAAMTRVYPTLRDPRLYALSFLVLPLGAIAFLDDSRLLETWSWPAELAPTLIEGIQARLPILADFAAFGLAPAVLLALGAPRDPDRRTLRRRTALLVLALLLLATGWTLVTPDLRQPKLGWLLAAAPALIALPLSAVVWRSQVGVGGAVAGLSLFALVLGQARLAEDLLPAWELLHDLDQTGVTDPMETYASFPPGTVRLLSLAWPLLLVSTVAYAWIRMLDLSHKHDPLTGIHNKAYADTILSQTGHHDLGTRYAVGAVDIDHFKRVNDRYGHAAGDVVLQATAQAIREQVGRAGVVCRTGGEELTVFLAGLGAAEARELLDQVRTTVAALRIPVTDNDGVAQELQVTISVGISTNLADDGTPLRQHVREVADAADKALYKAKRRGRNRVVIED